MNEFNWTTLRRFIKLRKPVKVDAGLLEDWYWTAATVYENKKFVKNHRAYLTSNWATPGFKAEMKNGDVLQVKAKKKGKTDE